MTQSRVLLLLLLAFNHTTSIAATDDEFMQQMFGVIPGAMIEFCSRSEPALRVQLEEEAKAFEVKMRKALAPGLSRLRSEGLEGVGLSKDQTEELRQKVVSSLKQADSRTYCLGLVQKLRTADPEALAEAAERQYRSYAAAAKDTRANVQR